MGYVRGFDEQILEALKSSDPEIHFQAVDAAGTWEIDEAWPHVVALVQNPRTPKPLVFAAIEAVGTIRPKEAEGILGPLTISDDEEIKEVALDVIGMAEGGDEWIDDEEDEEDDWVN
jgi:hypothetical protein